MMYYVGRSHFVVLPAVFAPWALCFLILFGVFLEKMATLKKHQEVVSGLVPGGGLFFLYALFFLQVAKVPSIQAEWRRHQINDRPDSVFVISEKITDLVRRSVSSGEKTLFLYPYADAVAMELGVKNVFSFSMIYSVFMKSQIEDVLETSKKAGVK